MEITKENLSEVNFAQQIGWSIKGTRKEIQMLQNTIERLLESKAYHTFKCNGGPDAIFEVTITDE